MTVHLAVQNPPRAALPPWPYKRLRLAGLDLQVIDHGPLHVKQELDAPAPTLCLIHGAHGNWHHWRANIEHLAQTHRVIVPDLPGFGLSDALPQEGLAELAEIMSGVADTLSVTSASWVGYSFGSLVATTLAGMRPALVNRLLLINPPGWRERSPEVMAAQVEAANRNREHGIRAALKFTLSEIMLQNHEKIDEACLDAFEFAVRNLRMVTKDISRTADLISLLKPVSKNWHIIFSVGDPYHRHWINERRSKLETLKGQPCTTIVSNARHWVQQDRPEAVNELLRMFANPANPMTMLPEKI